VKIRVGSRSSAAKCRTTYRRKIVTRTSSSLTRRNKPVASFAARCHVFATLSASRIWKPKTVRQVQSWEKHNTSAICAASSPSTTFSMLLASRYIICAPTRVLLECVSIVAAMATRESVAAYPLFFEILPPRSRSRVVQPLPAMPSTR